jgi:hypothetical protein
VIAFRIRTKDTRGFVVRDALVFVRSTPRVTTGGDRQVKAYRSGDPALAGIAGYRLVQVRLAG